MSMPANHLYTAFGLTIRSFLPLPELLPAPPDAVPEVEIVAGPVPDEIPGVLKRGARFQTSAHALRLQVDGIAVYLVEDGCRITIARGPEADDDDVRVFLLASAIAAVLHQRDDLVLHASAVEWQGGAVAFLGRSGVGKSTLAQAFRLRGHAVLTDDLCVIRPDAEGRMLAYPGFPHAKLWLDSLRKLELSPDGFRRIRRALEKRAVPLGESFRTSPLPVRKLYALNPVNKDQLKIVPVVGPGKFLILRTHSYRFGFLAAAERKTGHFQHAMRLAQQVPMATVVRSNGRFRLPDLVDLIAADLAQ